VLEGEAENGLVKVIATGEFKRSLLFTIGRRLNGGWAIKANRRFMMWAIISYRKSRKIVSNAEMAGSCKKECCHGMGSKIYCAVLIEVLYHIWVISIGCF